MERSISSKIEKDAGRKCEANIYGNLETLGLYTARNQPILAAMERGDYNIHYVPTQKSGIVKGEGNSNVD